MIQENAEYGQNISLSFHRLTKELSDLMSDFSCGNDTIDTFFKEKAADSEREVTYIFIDTVSHTVTAAVSLSCSSIIIGTENSISDAVPSVEITYFAVDLRYQKMPYSLDREDGYFSDMVMDYIIQYIGNLSLTTCGATHILLFSTPNAVHFYERNHFVKADSTLFMQRNTYYLEGCTQMFQEL